MEGNINHHGYLQEDMAFDDLINNAGWPGADSASQFTYQQQTHPQDPYSQQYLPPSQPSYNHFDLTQQASYPQVQYSNSPYTSPQYNHHARPSDVFGPTSFVDPSIQSAASYQGPESSFPFTTRPNEPATISPHSLQYNMSSNQPMNRAVSNSPFQQQSNVGVGAGAGAGAGAGNNFSQTSQGPSAIYFNNYQNAAATMQRNTGTPIQYPNLSNGVAENELKPGTKRTFDDLSSSASNAPQAKLEAPVYALRITHPELLNATDGSSRLPLAHAPFLSLKDEPIQVQLGLKNTLPKYHPRKSKSGRELVPGFNLSRALTSARVSAKKGRPPKDKTSTGSKYTGTSKVPKPVSDKINNFREDGSLVKSPSTPTETSSSEEEEPSSEEASEYEEDEEMPLVDISSVRGQTRPTNPPFAAKWDAIGIVWKAPHLSLNKEVIKDAIEKYATFVSTLRLQLKTNATKIEEATTRPAEVTTLKAARKELLGALYETINAAVQHGNKAIVENLGGHHKLVNGLTTTLIECIKADDFNGSLPKAVLSLLAKFQTMTDDLLKKLKFESLQKRWNKKGDEETKQKISEILSNTTDAKERAVIAKKAEEDKKAQEAIEQVKKRKEETMKVTAANSTKRPHDGDGINGKPTKKFASDVSGAPGSSAKLNPLKRPATNLLGIASKPAKPAAKKREPSPPQESKLGALLASIAKSPEPPKAPAAPPRPPETPEEQARRERKESRRHLRVKFKEGLELEQIRLFKHEQGEDEGRQDDMLRDANDSHNEGMMHKKRFSETIDETIEEDEYQPPDFEERPYTEPINIDFAPLPKTTTFGPTYSTRGGDLAFTTSEQKTQERREGVELIVVYTDPNDIPPSPKEPPQADGSAEIQPEREVKAPTEAWLVQRLQEINNYGPEQASQIFIRRQQEQMLKDARENRVRGFAQSFTPPPSANISSVLQQLGGPGQQGSATHLSHFQVHVKQGQSEMERQAHYDNLQLLLERVKPLIGKPYPPKEPPEWMINPTQRADWIEGYNRDMAAANEKKEAEQRMAAQAHVTPYQPLVAGTQFNQPVPSMQMQQYQAPQQIAHTQALDVNQQMQSIITGYGNGDSNAPAAQPFDFNSWGAATNNPGAAHTVGSSTLNQRSRRDESWGDDSLPKPNRPQNVFNAKGKKRNRESWDDGPLDKNGQYKGIMKPCQFFQQGKCAKGAKCTFSHAPVN